MKTKRNALKKVSRLILLLLIITIGQSCDTEIPPEDPTPPEFIFQISGDGFFHEFNQDSDFDNIQLNLKSGARYKFILSASDQGGVDFIQWFIPASDVLMFENPVPAPWSFTNISFLQSLVEWVGDRSNPLTGQAFSDHFTLTGNNLKFPFRFYVRDFGGENRRPNELSKELNISIGNHSTEIRSL